MTSKPMILLTPPDQWPQRPNPPNSANNTDSEFVWTGAGSNWLPVSGEFTLD